MKMSDLYSLQFVMLAQLAIGYVLRSVGFLSDENGRTLSKLVVNVFLPCQTVVAFCGNVSRAELSQCLHVLVISALIQVFCMVLGAVLYRRQPKARATVLRYGTVCSNAGVLGNTIAQGLFGSKGLLYASIYLIPARIVMWSAGVSYFSGKGDVKKVIKKVLTHPCIIAVEIGVVLLLTEWSPPAPVTSLLTQMGEAVAPLTMLFLGVTLASSGFKGMLTRTTSLYALVRLVLIPLVVLGGCLLCSVEGKAAAVSVILAAMPMGSSTALLASQYDGDVSFATHGIVLTTLLSLAILPVWMTVLERIFL